MITVYNLSNLAISSGAGLGHGFRVAMQGERFTINKPARLTVLDRLLALNHQRYEEEAKSGLHESKKPKSKTKGSRTSDYNQADLIP